MNSLTTSSSNPGQLRSFKRKTLFFYQFPLILSSSFTSSKLHFMLFKHFTVWTKAKTISKVKREMLRVVRASAKCITNVEISFSLKKLFHKFFKRFSIIDFPLFSFLVLLLLLLKVLFLFSPLFAFFYIKEGWEGKINGTFHCFRVVIHLSCLFIVSFPQFSLNAISPEAT